MTSTDGNRIVSRVEVGYTQLGTLSTEEQKMLYVLIKLWEDNGKPDTQVFFSSRGLARLLRKKGWGTNVIQAITKSLRKLRTIPIEWINSYYDKTKHGAVIVDRRPFTLLGELRIVERRQDGAVNNSQGYFKFDDHVLTNLQLNYTKPVCIEEFFELKSEIAQLIYSHIDLMLFDKNKYERRSRELFDDLGLKNAEYLHMYERKRAIDKALKELNGIRLSSGVLRSATIEKTTDGKDYKVSFAKSAAARIDVTAPDVLSEIVAPELVVNDYSKAKDPLVVQAEEVVLHFHKIFHGVETHYPQSREVAQALSLISQHGVAKARHVIEYSAKQAAATNFNLQHFGGILSYTSRALADLEKHSETAPQSKARAPWPSADPPPENPSRNQAELRLAALSPNDRASLREKVISELQARLPRFDFGNAGAMHEAMIRSGMLRELQYEERGLMILPQPGTVYFFLLERCRQASRAA